MLKNLKHSVRRAAMSYLVRIGVATAMKEEAEEA
jgi:hypothetical protein